MVSRLQPINFLTNLTYLVTLLTKGYVSFCYERNTCNCFVNLHRGKMRSRDPKFGSLYRGFCSNGVRYIGVFVITGFVISGFLPVQITVMLLNPKKYFFITGTSLYRASLPRGSTQSV